MAGEPPWRAGADGLFLAVRLTPRGGRDAIGAVETLADGRAVLTARVRAAPTEGEANAALVKLLAKALKVPARDIDLVQGETSRIKTVLIRGDAAALAERLAGLPK